MHRSLRTLSAMGCLRVGICLAVLWGCAPSPGTSDGIRYDGRVDADFRTDARQDARSDDSTVRQLDAKLELDSRVCVCSMAGEEESRSRSSACGDYDEKRTCNGCVWTGWAGTPPQCACTPESTGATREMNGGTGCMKGKKTQQEVCKDDGTGFVWVDTSDYDGSEKECAAGANGTQMVTGECQMFEQTRTCTASCAWGAWQGTEGVCYPDQQFVGQACRTKKGTCECRRAGTDTCTPVYDCGDGFAWETGDCPGQATVCCTAQCGAMDAVGNGDNACPLGYKWTGSSCLLVRGCGGCSGADCSNLMTFAQCQDLKNAC